MTNITYDQKTRRMYADIDGSQIRIDPVMRTLDHIGQDISTDPTGKRLTSIVHHNGWSTKRVCPVELYTAANHASEQYEKRLPKGFTDRVHAASSEIALGTVGRLDLGDPKYTEQVLTSLDDIGTTWLYTDDKKQAEDLIRRMGIPIVISLKDLDEDERIDAMTSTYRIIHPKSLVKDAIQAYDEATLSKGHPDNKKFKAMELDDLGIGVGLNLYNQGLAEIKFHEE